MLESPDLLAPAVEAAAPAGARVTVLEGAGASARLTARLRSFSLPLDIELIQLDARARRAGEGAVDRLARSLRQGRGQLSMAGGSAVRVEVGPGETEDGRLEARHALTTVSFDGGSGAFLSRWRHLGPGLDQRAGPRYSTIEGALPSSTASESGESRTLRFDLHGVPLALLTQIFPLEERVARLVGARLKRLELEGLDAGVLIGRAPGATSVDVEFVTAADDRLSGTVSAEGFFVRLAFFDLPLDEAVIADVVQPLLPWVEAIGRSRRRRPSSLVRPRQLHRPRERPARRIERPDAREAAAARGPPARVSASRPAYRARTALGALGAGGPRRRVRSDQQDVPGRGAAARWRAVGGAERYEPRRPIQPRGSAPTLLRNLGGQSVDEDARVQIEISNQSDLERPRVLVSPAEFVTAIEEIIDMLKPKNGLELLDYLRGK